MFRGDKWWVREIERMNRAHAADRAELVATICRLSGKPMPDAWQPTVRPAVVQDPDRQILEEA